MSGSDPGGESGHYPVSRTVDGKIGLNYHYHITPIAGVTYIQYDFGEA